MRTIRFRKLSRRYLDLELSTADDVAVRIVERPGLWMQQDEVTKMVEELRSVVVAVLDGRSLDYGVFTGEKQALDRAVVTLVYDRASGLPTAFNALSLLRVTLRGREVEIIHLGLAMVHPNHRGRGLSAVLYGLTCTLLFFRSQMRPMWVTNVSQVPSVVGLVSETLSNVYPSPDPLKHRSFDHLVIAREIMKRHRRVFGVAAEAEGYDASAISRIFEDGSAVVSLASLRHEISSRGGVVAEAVEELVHILEKYDMTHAALVCGEPPTLLLLNLPQVAPQPYEVQVRLIQKYSRLLERTAPAGA